MAIDLELYRTFYRVASCGNIIKAVNEMYVSLPAISKSIQRLEERICRE